MGNATLGNTAGGSSPLYWYQDTTHGVAVFSNDNVVAPEGMYIDAIHVFGNSESSNAGACVAALYDGSGGTKYGTTNTFTMGTSTQYWTASFPSSSLLYLPSGADIRAAVLESGGGGFRTWGRGDGGSWRYELSVSSLPSAIGGSTQSGLGNWPWYISYFKTCQVYSASPTAATEGTTVTLSGRSFTAGVTSITFNGVAASGWTVVNDTTITVAVPSGATSGVITVNTHAGSDSSPTFYVNPNVTGISPSHGAPGASVTITGTGFNSSTNVKFSSGVAASYTVNSDTQITATVPHGAVTGVITVYGGNSSDTSSTFTVDSSITSFSPTAGGIGTSVTLTGTGFTGATSGKFNGTLGTSFTVVSDTSITMVVPSGATTGFITIINSGGSTITSATQFIVASANVFRSGSWVSGPVDVERSGVETQAQGVLVYRSGSWVSAE